MKEKRREAERALPRLAEAVRRSREVAGFTQEDVAYKAAISVRHYQALESGRLNPSYLTLLTIAKALGTRLGDLINEVR